MPSRGLCGVALGLGALGVDKVISEGPRMVLAASLAPRFWALGQQRTVLQTMAHCPFPAASVQAKTYSPQGPQYENSLIPEISQPGNVARSTRAHTASCQLNARCLPSTPQLLVTRPVYNIPPSDSETSPFVIPLSTIHAVPLANNTSAHCALLMLTL
jgi:hypothetical protein